LGGGERENEDPGGRGHDAPSKQAGTIDDTTPLPAPVRGPV
jgi:hypothetical protein